MNRDHADTAVYRRRSGLARLVDRGLTRLGFKVVHAAGGAAGLARLAQGGIDVIALDQYMPGLDGLETLERILAIPDAPPVVFVTASQDSAIAVTALKAGAADYLVKDVQGDFIPLLQVAVDGAVRQAMRSQGPRRGRGRSPRLARPLCGARRRARGAAARGQPPRRQLAADHRLAAAPAGQFGHPGRRQGGADQCDGPRRRGRAGASPALHLARSQERAAEPVSRSAAGGSPALGRGQQDVAADAQGRTRSRSIRTARWRSASSSTSW